MNNKLVELNIRHGGGKRIPQFLKRVIGYNADVIVLTEFRHNQNSDIIRNKLLDEGYKWQTAAIENRSVNTVFVASKLHFESVPLIDLPAECTGRAVLVRFERFSLMGVYFAQKKEKKLLFDYIINSTIPALGSRELIIGDFNTGKHYVDEPGKTFYCADSFSSLEDSGLIDSWRKRNIDKKEYSWYSPAGNGFRIDHVFSTKEIDGNISYVGYDHTPRLEGETDHSALIVECNNL